jgi:hypothetical protein
MRRRTRLPCGDPENALNGDRSIPKATVVDLLELDFSLINFALSTSSEVGRNDPFPSWLD